MPDSSYQDLQAWVGRTQAQADTIDALRTGALLTALGRPARAEAGDPLGLLHHWLYFWDARPPEALGPDGHPKLGGFMPPVPLPRRMWAGGRIDFHAPLRIGDPARRVTTIKAVQAKSGRGGDLVFVTLLHETSGPGGLAIAEEQDIVYRQPAPPTSGPPATEAADWRQTVIADPVLLFRYSALTLNGHRIHYDQPYATGVEGYPGLVIHGPLQATLMVALALDHLPGAPRRLEYRGLSPACDTAPLQILGRRAPEGAELWTEQNGRVCMTGRLVY
jgi:3-methylfumaryl-CoA hydratase